MQGEGQGATFAIGQLNKLKIKKQLQK